MKTLKHFLRNDGGNTAIEYALIAGGLTIVIVASIQPIGGALVTMFGDLAAGL